MYIESKPHLAKWTNAWKTWIQIFGQSQMKHDMDAIICVIKCQLYKAKVLSPSAGDTSNLLHFICTRAVLPGRF